MEPSRRTTVAPPPAYPPPAPSPLWDGLGYVVRTSRASRSATPSFQPKSLFQQAARAFHPKLGDMIARTSEASRLDAVEEFTGAFVETSDPTWYGLHREGRNLVDFYHDLRGARSGPVEKGLKRETKEEQVQFMFSTSPSSWSVYGWVIDRAATEEALRKRGYTGKEDDYLISRSGIHKLYGQVPKDSRTRWPIDTTIHLSTQLFFHTTEQPDEIQLYYLDSAKTRHDLFRFTLPPIEQQEEKEEVTPKRKRGKEEKEEEEKRPLKKQQR
jgi:hypothetical protein